MRKEEVENIFNRLINMVYKKIRPKVPIEKKPEIELVHELYDIYNDKPKFEIYINTFNDDKVTNDAFNSFLRLFARNLQLVDSFNYKIFYNTNIPERLDELMSLSEKLKTELENYLSGYDSKDCYFKVEFVGPENTNWVGMDAMAVRVIVELHTTDPNDDDIVNAAEKTLDTVLTRMVKGPKYDMFEGYALYMDVHELDKPYDDLENADELPYDDESINEDVKLRTFDINVNAEELKWHRDREDRLVEIIDGENWGLQFDNELPIRLVKGESYIIPEGVYHRVIKGDGELKVKINYL